MHDVLPVVDNVPPTADVCDLMGPAVRLLSLPWLRFGRRPRFAGPAVTFKADSDTALIRPILEEPGRGRVLVIDNDGRLEPAVFGDRFASLMIGNSWAGAVVHGAIRDTQAIRELDVGVFALGVCPLRPAKNGAGERSDYLHVGGVRVRLGDWVVGDADGLVVVPFEKLTQSGLI